MTGQVRPAPRPLRSLLFVPGHRDKWVQPAKESGTDGIVFDLEDAVPVHLVTDARRVVSGAIESAADGDGPAIIVRVGVPGTDAMWSDLDVIVQPGLAGVMMPLVSTADEVKAVADRLDQLEEKRGIPVGSTAVVPLVETASAARFAYEIASSTERVAYMGGGTSRQGDLARSMGFRWSREGNETLMLRSWVLMNVRAAGVPYPTTGLWGTVDDLDGLRFWAEQSRDLGYTGTMIIHPSHVAIVNEAFTPSRAEIDAWFDVIKVMRTAQAEGLGAIRYHGELIDEAHVKTAEVGLDFARKLGLVPEEEVRSGQ